MIAPTIERSAMCSGAALFEVVARYEEVLAHVVERYGDESHAAFLTRFQYLVALHGLAVGTRSEGPLATVMADSLADEVQRHYDRSIDDWPTPPCRRLSSSPPLIEYDRDYYELNYRRVGDTIAADVLTLDRCALRRLEAARLYLYAVDEHGALRVYGRPLALEDLLLQRNPAVADGTVVHPMLVVPTLRVRAAGELVLIGNGRVARVVANTKSGHFCPPRSSAEVVRECCRTLFGLADCDVTVFTIPTPERAEPVSA